MDWWVTKTDRNPLGPVSTELLLRGIGAGKVPEDALVCEVGGTSWKPIQQIEVFAAALVDRQRARGSNPGSDPGVLDMPVVVGSTRGPPPRLPPLPRGNFDDATELTIAERPAFTAEPPSDALHAFDEAAEKTIVDPIQFRPSEPPPK